MSPGWRLELWGSRPSMTPAGLLYPPRSSPLFTEAAERPFMGQEGSAPRADRSFCVLYTVAQTGLTPRAPPPTAGLWGLDSLCTSKACGTPDFQMPLRRASPGMSTDPARSVPPDFSSGIPGCGFEIFFFFFLQLRNA